ncbi:hypothetical protein KZZ52_28345 [Dactylosporangium sp. AC04546]|uniref:hypothetical protein n=1 Tax=Dactylosporangium sp. AC04546 TaxID=2862460 RepID=UPI001EDFDE4E|nr:hypothetical protein [Dactylosporangium sp. AC04546]WVK89180.1 hypothetical protein KZZ52_28345 [Dactylosporangium sp. AC04546]
MSGQLERRYRALLHAYPAAYRAERGDEIVGTYLDLAAPGRRWPGPADAADLVRGGVRQHLRAAGATGLPSALPIAATIALALNTVMAVFWFAFVESTRVTAHGSDSIASPPGYGFGPFASPGVVVWGCWAAAAVGALAGRARPLVALALAATVLVAPVSAVFDRFRPPIMILLPMIALGLVALAMPRRPRFTPALAGLASAAYTWPTMFMTSYSPADYYPVVGFLPLAAGLLGLGVLSAAVPLAARRDPRAWWPALVLLGPFLLLLVNDLALLATGNDRSTHASMPSLIAMAVAVSSVAALVFVTILGVRQRRRRSQRRGLGYWPP